MKKKRAVSYFRSPIRHAHVDCKMTAGWRTKQCRARCTSRYRRIVHSLCCRLRLLLLLHFFFSLSLHCRLVFHLNFLPVSVEKFFRHSFGDSTRAALSEFALEASPPHTHNHCTSTRPHGFNFVSLGRIRRGAQTLERSETNNSWLCFFPPPLLKRRRPTFCIENRKKKVLHNSFSHIFSETISTEEIVGANSFLWGGRQQVVVCCRPLLDNVL